MILKHFVKFVFSLFLFAATLHAQCDTFKAISAGGAHTLALQSNGTVWAWGSNESGQLGTGGGGNSNVRHQVLDLNNVSAISAGGNFSLALKTDGTVWAWGDNSDGQLGNGAQNNSSFPIQVIQLTDVKAIAAGDSFALALKNDGTVWAWGSNSSGQLGDGTTFSSNFPVQVTNTDLMVATAIAAGTQFSLAIRSDGKVLSWGNNSDGQLGNGDPLFLNSSVPVFVSDADLTSASAIAAGDDHALAIKNDGTVWAWGNNDSGQLGDGTFTSFNAPVQVVNTFLTTATAISAGAQFSLAIRNDDTVWAWGNNEEGSLGIGTTSFSQNEPVQTVNTHLMSSVASISAGGLFSLALKHDGTIWAWGTNDVGQLGNGTNRNSAAPVAVALAPVADFVSATFGSCNGQPLHIPLSANLPGTLFTWTVVQNGVTGGSDGSGTAIDVVFTLIPPNEFGFAMYTITPSIGSCVGEPVFLYVFVSENTVVTATPASQTLCSGSLTNIKLSATTGSNFFTWTALSVGVIGASDGCGASINQTLVATGTTPGTVVYTITQNADPKCPSSPTLNPCINTPIIATVIVEPCGPTPPSNFCGKVKKRKCGKQTDIVHVLTWTPSADPTVEGYRIYEGDNLIDSVPASGPFKVVIASRNSKKQYTYSLVAINRFGNESTRLTITLSNKNSRHGNQVCTDCPASTSCSR